MTDYQNKVAEKVTQIFKESAKRSDWDGCHDKVVELLIEELGKSFRNGVRWARQKK